MPGKHFPAKPLPQKLQAFQPTAFAIIENFRHTFNPTLAQLPHCPQRRSRYPSVNQNTKQF
jgi:hypothetical protein